MKLAIAGFCFMVSGFIWLGIVHPPMVEVRYTGATIPEAVR